MSSNLNEYLKTHNNIILIDGSYFVFYRFCALSSYLRLACKDDYDKIMSDPINNELFVEKFDKFCKDSFMKIYKNYGNKKEKLQLIVSKDCPRENIWRMIHHEDYKAGRKKTNNIGHFFEYFYNKIIPELKEMCILVEHDNLESDDCIAILTKYIIKMQNQDKTNGNDKSIVIISSDKDYLQLVDNTLNTEVRLIDLRFKEVLNNKDNKKDLFEKIVNGDVSDNIPPICEKRLSKLKINKYFENQEAFMNELIQKEKENYEKNKLLIDFEYIPKKLEEEFLSSYSLFS